jgi:tRNA-dihydrouridine synthase
MVAATGCDAVMIGRTAPANPWIFRQIEQYCEKSTSPPSPKNGEEWGTRTSGAKAPNDFGNDIGTTEVVPFPVVPTANGSPYDEPSESDRYQMIRTYFRMLIEEELPDATGKMKQFASWFTHGVPGGAALRKAIYDSKTAPEILLRVEEFFEARLAATVTA